MIRPLVLCVSIVLAMPALAFAGRAVDPKSVDALAKDTLSRWNVPGLSILIVRDDEVAYLHGHGVREIGKKDAVTPDTVFALASLTKAMAAAGLAILVDDGKADWDDRVSKHVPGFRLRDELANREVRLRDLLCHRTGLVRHDLLWYRAAWSLDETVKRLEHLEPTHSFRARYDYCNLGYIVAGLAIGGGKASEWEPFMRKRLLEPLGMKNVHFTRKAVLEASDRATPHRIAGGKAKPIEWYPDDKQVRASGSIKASARDLAGWVRLNLNGGVVDGKRIVSAKSMKEMHTPQVVIPVEAEAAKLAGTTQQSYCLGWRMLDFHGRRVLEHGGAADGLRARIVLLPKEKTGFVLLANLQDDRALLALGNLLIEELLGVKKNDWHGFYLKQREATEKRDQAQKKALLAARKPNTKPSRELADYAGKYSDKAYGTVTIAADKGLVLTWSSFESKLAHWQDDVFIAALTGSRLDGQMVRFTVSDGKVTRVQLLGQTFARE